MHRNLLPVVHRPSATWNGPPYWTALAADWPHEPGAITEFAACWAPNPAKPSSSWPGKTRNHIYGILSIKLTKIQRPKPGFQFSCPFRRQTDDITYIVCVFGPNPIWNGTVGLSYDPSGLPCRCYYLLRLRFIEKRLKLPIISSLSDFRKGNSVG